MQTYPPPPAAILPAKPRLQAPPGTADSPRPHGSNRGPRNSCQIVPRALDASHTDKSQQQLVIAWYSCTWFAI